MIAAAFLLGSAITWLTVAVVDGNPPALIAFMLTLGGLVGWLAAGGAA